MLHHMLRAAAQRAFNILDPYFQYVTMLLHGDGTNAAQNNTFLDSSTNNITITRVGNTTQGTFTPYGSNWSNYFDGAGNYFQTPASSATTIVGTLSSTVNLTIECWIYPTAYNSSANFPGLIGDMVATSENNNWSWGLTNTGTLMLYWNISGTQYRATSSAAVSLNTWTHIALNVASGSITMYANGVSQTLSGTTTLGTPSGSNGYLVIGQWNNGSGGTGGISNGLYTGYISNLRVVKASTYTSSFTPSTVPLTAITSTSLLYCQSNRFIDTSSNALAITVNGSPSVQRFSPFSPTTAYDASVIGGSSYMDGTGDYLYFPNNAALSFGTGDFCVEAYVYKQRAANEPIIDSRATNNASPWAIYIDGSNFPYFYEGTSYTSSIAITLNAWNHVAVTRSSGTLKIFVNGVQGYSATVTTNLDRSSGNEVIGATVVTFANPWLGFMSSFRIVKGSAVYTTAFTPPTAPLTAITNTSLLLSYTNAGILDNAMMNNLETVGNAQISTSVKKYGTGSMYFDGSGDRLFEPSNQNFNFGTGDFTIELWAYPISQGGHGSSNNDCLIDFRPATGGGAYGTLYIFSSGTGVYWYANTGNRITGGAISNSVWTHIAICRSSGSTKLFLNGTQSGSTYTDATNYLVAPIMIGEFNDGAGAGNFNGYIDDLRITKGVARYTATFTPPTAAFPNN